MAKYETKIIIPPGGTYVASKEDLNIARRVLNIMSEIDLSHASVDMPDDLVWLFKTERRNGIEMRSAVSNCFPICKKEEEAFYSAENTFYPMVLKGCKVGYLLGAINGEMKMPATDTLIRSIQCVRKVHELAPYTVEELS